MTTQSEPGAATPEAGTGGAAAITQPVPATGCTHTAACPATPADPCWCGCHRVWPAHVVDRLGYVWRVVRDGGMATRADYGGAVSIGMATLERDAGPLLPFDAAKYLSEYPRAEAECEVAAGYRAPGTCCSPCAAGGGVREIARATGLNVATVHNILYPKKRGAT